MKARRPLNLFARQVCLLKVGPANFFTFASFLLLFCSCDSRLNKQSYIKWVTDYQNNLHVKSYHADLIFDLQYQPAAYVLIQRGIENYNPDSLLVEVEKLSDVQYYILTISTKDKVDLINYGLTDVAAKQQRQYYFSYRFQDNIALDDDGKILPCILYHAQKPTTADGGRVFVLGFENPNRNSVSAKIVITSDVLNASPVKIEIAKSNIPQVDL